MVLLSFLNDKKPETEEILEVRVFTPGRECGGSWGGCVLTIACLGCGMERVGGESRP